MPCRSIDVVEKNIRMTYLLDWQRNAEFEVLAEFGVEMGLCTSSSFGVTM
jgi:hypothetical protein